jgi:hypothetical protein
MKGSQKLKRLGHTRFTSCSSDFVTGVNIPVVFRMKIKISHSRISLLTSGIICLNLLKNKIFKIKIWSLASENT